MNISGDDRGLARGSGRKLLLPTDETGATRLQTGAGPSGTSKAGVVCPCAAGGGRIRRYAQLSDVAGIFVLKSK